VRSSASRTLDLRRCEIASCGRRACLPLSWRWGLDQRVAHCCLEHAGQYSGLSEAGFPACSSDPAAQDYGRPGANGAPVGRNGVLVWKASDVSVENLTVCNFLAGTGASGNQIWWNGGADSGKIGLTGYWGSYLTATSTFFGDETTAAEYGIFAGNSAGPAALTQLYGSNMNDSGAYVGAPACGSATWS